MKKLGTIIISAVMLLAVAFTLGACGEKTPVDDPNKDNGGNNNTDVIAVDTTISDASLKVDLNGHKLYVTSLGQAADYNTVCTLLTSSSVGLTEDAYTADATLVASSVAAGDTVILVAGASDKGMGAAGINAADEIARAKAFAARKTEINIIVIQAGGSARRGETSDAIYAAVCPAAKVTLIVASADEKDGLFKNSCTKGTLYTYSRATTMAGSIKFILGL